jgi:uncharacterized membrane protein YdjX (TVP38/TMEM64 family)
MKWFIGIAIGLFALFTVAFLLADSWGLTKEQFVVTHLTALHNRNGNDLLIGSVLFLLLVGDLVLPVPSSIVMTLSGYFLGWIAGALVAFLGATASAAVGFSLCRRFGQKAFNRLIGQKVVSRVQRFFDRYGVWAIVLSRSVPMLTEVMSCLAGMSLIRFPYFLVLSAVGTLPVCIVYAWAGSNSQRTPTGIGWAVFLAFVIPAAGFAWVRAVSAKKHAFHQGT